MDFTPWQEKQIRAIRRRIAAYFTDSNDRQLGSSEIGVRTHLGPLVSRIMGDGALQNTRRSLSDGVKIRLSHFLTELGKSETEVKHFGIDFDRLREVSKYTGIQWENGVRRNADDMPQDEKDIRSLKSKLSAYFKDKTGRWLGVAEIDQRTGLHTMTSRILGSGELHYTRLSLSENVKTRLSDFLETLGQPNQVIEEFRADFDHLRELTGYTDRTTWHEGRRNSSDPTPER